MEFVTIESHFWVPDNAIRPETRNVCSRDLVAMIYRIAEILYPEEKFEILILPPEQWSYKDIFKITWSIAIWIATVAWTVLWYLTYKDAHENHIIDMALKCSELVTHIEQLSGNDESYNVDYKKLQIICEDHWMKRLKNSRYKSLENDNRVSEEETIIKTPDNRVIYQNKVERKDFEKMIVYLPENEEYKEENLEWVIELVSLVIKQEKNGRWIAWRGTYYGNPIVYWWLNILMYGDLVNFYMQDKEFKKKIDDHTITFASWDNITVLFNITGEIKNWVFQNRSIYIKEVKNFNEVVIDHTPKKNNNKNEYQSQWLFDNIEF